MKYRRHKITLWVNSIHGSRHLNAAIQNPTIFIERVKLFVFLIKGLIDLTIGLTKKPRILQSSQKKKNPNLFLICIVHNWKCLRKCHY